MDANGVWNEIKSKFRPYGRPDGHVLRAQARRKGNQLGELRCSGHYRSNNFFFECGKNGLVVAERARRTEAADKAQCSNNCFLVLQNCRDLYCVSDSRASGSVTIMYAPSPCLHVRKKTQQLFFDWAASIPIQPSIGSKCTKVALSAQHNHTVIYPGSNGAKFAMVRSRWPILTQQAQHQIQNGTLHQGENQSYSPAPSPHFAFDYLLSKLKVLTWSIPTLSFGFPSRRPRYNLKSLHLTQFCHGGGTLGAVDVYHGLPFSL